VIREVERSEENLVCLGSIHQPCHAIEWLLSLLLMHDLDIPDALSVNIHTCQYINIESLIRSGEEWNTCSLVISAFIRDTNVANASIAANSVAISSRIRLVSMPRSSRSLCTFITIISQYDVTIINGMVNGGECCWCFVTLASCACA
jgi:hypothetical protein